MKRVCFLINGDYYTESRAQKMCHSLSENGYKVFVLAWDRSGKLTKQEKDGLIIIINIKVVCPHGSGIKAVPKILRTFPRYFSHLKKISPDIIHCQNFFLWPLALVSGYILKSKVILDSLEPYAEQKSAMFGGLNFFKNIIWFIEKILFRRATKRITVSEGMAERYMDRGLRNIDVILNTPDSQFSNVLVTKSKDEKFKIGRIGSIDAYKSGVDILIEATRIIYDEGIPARLILGGPINGIFEKEFKELLLKNIDCIEYIGIVHYKDLPLIITSFDCVVAPYQKTSIGEKYGYSVKMFEAMALGVPIIISNMFETSKVLDNYQCGIVISPPVTAEKISEKLKQIIFNPIFRSKLGMNGKKAFKEKYSWEVSEKKLIKIYNDLL